MKNLIIAALLLAWNFRATSFTPSALAQTSNDVTASGSYLGGNNFDNVRAVATDAQGNIYLTGSTQGSFPGQIVGKGGNYDVFVTKIDRISSRILYSVRVGGVKQFADQFSTPREEGLGIAVDRFGNAYVVGRTASRDFPTTPNALQMTASGNGDNGFIFKLDPTGSRLLFSTYFGGARARNAVPAMSSVNDVALGPNDDIFVTGETSATDFPVKGAFQAQLAGDPRFAEQDAFVARLSADGGIRYATYLGGVGSDVGQVIAVDRSGNAFVAGTSLANGFPLQNPIQDEYRGGGTFVSKISPLGNRLLFSTYLDGESIDEPTDLAVSGSDQVVLTGTTSSARFPTEKPLHPARRGRSDIFVAKIDVAAPRLVFSTYFGGTGDESGGGVSVARDGSIVVSGGTQSSDLPTLNAFQSTLKGGSDAFYAVLSSDGQRLLGASYFGGLSTDGSSAAVLNNGDDLILAGTTISTDLPVRNGFQPRPGDGDPAVGDGFVAIVNPFARPLVDVANPGVSFSQPQNGARLAAFPIISGVATDVQNGGDAGTGVARVVLFIKRSRDGKYFSGRNWAGVPVALETQIDGETWRFRNVPAGLNAQDGTYFLSAVAFDRAGNRSLPANVTLIVDRSAPAVPTMAQSAT